MIDFIDVDAKKSETGWYVVWATGAKVHFVHKCLLSSLVSDLEARLYPVSKIEEAKIASLDLGGSIFQGMPYEHIKIDSLKMSVWSHQVLGTIDLILGYPENPRKFADGTEYFKIHFPHTCLVVTPDQQALLIEALAEIADMAEERYDDFMDKLEKKIDGN